MILYTISLNLNNTLLIDKKLFKEINEMRFI